jgi:hypothetical protein
MDIALLTTTTGGLSVAPSDGSERSRRFAAITGRARQASADHVMVMKS